MLQNFLVVLMQVLTLFAIMAVGFALEKIGRISHAGTAEMSTILLYVVSPCVVINAFQIDRDPKMLQILGGGCAALAVCFVAYILVCQLFFKKAPPSIQAPLRFGCIYGNVGFIGLPLVRAVIGEAGVFYAVLIIVVAGIFCWTHGIILMGGRENVSLRQAFLNPGTVSMVVALVFFLGQVRLTGPIYSALGFICELNTPLAMLVVGAQLARSDLLSTFRSKRLYMASAIKLLLVPAVTAILLLPFRGDPVFYLTMILLSGVPAAGSTSMFAQKFDRDERVAAQFVSLSTLLSAGTLPFVAVFANLVVGFS